MIAHLSYLMASITQEFHIKHHLLREHLNFSVTGATLTECLEKAKQYAREYSNLKGWDKTPEVEFGSGKL
jgi:primosomal protein N''